MCADPEAGDHEFGGAEAVVRIVSETWEGGRNSLRLMIKRCLFLAFQNYFDYVCEENILSS